MCFNTIAMPTPSSASDSSPPPLIFPPAYPEATPGPSVSGSVPEGSIRKRVVRACEVCRRKKVKCNGQKPCSHCIAFAEECFYVDVKDRSAYSRRYVESLELRLAKLEKAWALAFETGGLGRQMGPCGGRCLLRDEKDVTRRASDPGSGSGRQFTMQSTLEQTNQHQADGSASTGSRLITSNIRESAAAGQGSLLRDTRAYSTTNTSSMNIVHPQQHLLLSPKLENSPARSQMSGGKRRAEEEAEASRNFDAASKRYRAATLPQSRPSDVPAPISRSETAPPLHPLPQAHFEGSHHDAQLGLAYHPNLPHSAPLQWPSNAELGPFFSNSTSMLPFPPLQVQRTQNDAHRAQASAFDAGREPIPEELAGLLRQFMEHERSQRH